MFLTTNYYFHPLRMTNKALNIKVLVAFAALAILLVTCQAKREDSISSVEKIDRKEAFFARGLTLAAPPKPFASDPFEEMLPINSDWICIVPYAFTPSDDPTVRYNKSHYQWWGEKPEGIIESTRLARKHKHKVLLKPQVWFHRLWVGDFALESEEDWQKWEAAYTAFMVQMANQASELGIEMLCVGTEFKKAVSLRPDYWTELIQEIRKIYSGKLTYAANWDNYQNIPFWDQLDVIGVNAYFPLVNDVTPSVDRLNEAWRPIKNDLKTFSDRFQKPIMFTEYGYLSVDGCAYNTWELEDKIQDISANEQAQANAFEALYSSFWNEEWWLGGFIWKWYPNGDAHNNHVEKDYTPQNKKSFHTISKWFD